jgi:hypothetical protein
MSTWMLAGWNIKSNLRLIPTGATDVNFRTTRFRIWHNINPRESATTTL